jgi:hypothetical protein
MIKRWSERKMEREREKTEKDIKWKKKGNQNREEWERDEWEKKGKGKREEWERNEVKGTGKGKERRTRKR